MKNLRTPTPRSFVFHGTEMRLRLTTAECDGAYCIMEMIHGPNVGPALHRHPYGRETFIVISGSYLFNVNGTPREMNAGEMLSVPKNTPHSYKSGPHGGIVQVIMPPNLDKYFLTVAEMGLAGPYTFHDERIIAERYGQIFLNGSSHW